MLVVVLGLVVTAGAGCGWKRFFTAASVATQSGKRASTPECRVASSSRIRNCCSTSEWRLASSSSTRNCSSSDVSNDNDACDSCCESTCCSCCSSSS